MPVQLRFDTGLAGERYVSEELWRLARLERCPLHPAGGCALARHGSYERKAPEGTRIARWYCPQGHCTFSLLPDHLAARLPGTLAELERVVQAAEQAPSQQACADALRPDAVSLPSALRWLRRRLQPTHALLLSAVTLLPQLLQGCAPTIAALRLRLQEVSAPAVASPREADAAPAPAPAPVPVLERLRALLALQLPALGRPLGFRHRCAAAARPAGSFQQHMGPDPPGCAA